MTSIDWIYMDIYTQARSVIALHMLAAMKEFLTVSVGHQNC